MNYILVGKTYQKDRLKSVQDFSEWTQRWITVKWILTVLLVAIGAGYMGVTIKGNMVYAKKLLIENADTSIFFAHVRHVAIAGIAQLIGFAYIIVISVVKPWKKKNASCKSGYGRR